MSDSATTADTPVRRAEFRELTLQQQEAFLAGIRERRLRTVQAYAEMQAQKREKLIAGYKEKWDKHLAMWDKEIATVEKNLEKLEKRLTSMRAVHIAMEDVE